MFRLIPFFNRTDNSAYVAVRINDLGTSARIIQYGICWSATNPEPTVSDINTQNGECTSTRSFVDTITGLSRLAEYYVCAYTVDNLDIPLYSEAETFSTIASLPTVVTSEVDSVTSNSIFCGGDIIENGGAEILAKGICWSTNSEPTIDDDTTLDGSGDGSFISQITGLDERIQYYFKAYARNSLGVAYGEEKSKRTLGDAPIVITESVVFIEDNDIKVIGNIVDDGGYNIIGIGICWSTTPDPTIDNCDDYTNEELTITGIFNSSIYNLSIDTKYYFKAYAQYSGLYSYGDTISFVLPKPCPSQPVVPDIDGNEYKTVLIGTQCWMQENLKTTHYADGTQLVDGTGAGDITGDYTTRYYFYYDDNPLYAETYGLLYTWAAVMGNDESSVENPSGVQGACPDGWHIPSDEEWKQLEMHLGMSQSQIDSTSWRGTDEGVKLKAASRLWINPNVATNVSGFTALPGGVRFEYPLTDLEFFDHLGIRTGFRTCTEGSDTTAWRRFLSYRETISRLDNPKERAYSVRCVKD